MGLEDDESDAMSMEFFDCAFLPFFKSSVRLIASCI